MVSILDTFFDTETMSVHFMAHQSVVAKKGRPGGRHMEELHFRYSEDELQHIIAKLQEEVQERSDAFLEIERQHAQVLQVGPYRVVIVRPPLSSNLEITAVRPVKKLSLADYKLDDQVISRLMNKAKGILISGAPGEGKTTFAQAVVDQLVQQNVIIKTIESPRDLNVDPRIVQYSFSHAPHNDIRDILLLSRPDYTVYDEIRNASDFLLYKDLRLTGIGLIGVMHATHAIDSIQRFLGTVDMGTIPQIVDTVIFIQAGQISQILTIEQVVKVPAGMISEDLSRPVLHIKNFYDDKVLYEIYSYGDNVIVMPMDQVEAPGTKQKLGVLPFAQHYLQDYICSMLHMDLIVSVDNAQSITLYVPEASKGRVIGKSGENIQELERHLGVSISVRSLDELPAEKAVALEEMKTSTSSTPRSNPPKTPKFKKKRR